MGEGWRSCRPRLTVVALPLYNPTSICNRALRKVPDRPIASLDENSLQARECAAAYADCVQELLEDHPWEFAYARSTLASVPNDRSGEWAFAYAMPDQAAYLGKVLLPQDLSIGGTVVNDPNGVVPIVVQPRNYLGYPDVPSYVGSLDDMFARAPAWRTELRGRIIYTDAPTGAVAEYTANTLTENVFTAQFVHALHLLIAARVAPALTKDPARSNAILSEYELYANRAKANDRNRQVDRYGDNLPDWVAVRGW